ncbi:MAG: hypothetical protein H6976_15105 [Gammaproteobacteria bacterium]|nr:hypothetical protein [Gammaproteobacteria bacterium]
MDKSLLIAIFVPTTDEAEKTFKGKRGELATGYPVGKDLILTAGHILKPHHRTIAMNAIQYGYAGIVPVPAIQRTGLWFQTRTSSGQVRMIWTRL